MEKPKLTNQFRVSNDANTEFDYDDLSFLIDESLITVDTGQIPPVELI